jgi:hypothetical protein
MVSHDLLRTSANTAPAPARQVAVFLKIKEYAHIAALAMDLAFPSEWVVRLFESSGPHKALVAFASYVLRVAISHMPGS